MATKLTQDQLLKLEILPAEVKADITALFADISERDEQIKTLRKKNEDADVVVKRAPELEKLTKEQGEKIALLNTELAKHTGTVANEDFCPEIFRPFFEWFS